MGSSLRTTTTTSAAVAASATTTRASARASRATPARPAPSRPLWSKMIGCTAESLHWSRHHVWSLPLEGNMVDLKKRGGHAHTAAFIGVFILIPYSGEREEFAER